VFINQRLTNRPADQSCRSCDQNLHCLRLSVWLTFRWSLVKALGAIFSLGYNRPAHIRLSQTLRTDPGGVSEISPEPITGGHISTGAAGAAVRKITDKKKFCSNRHYSCLFPHPFNRGFDTRSNQSDSHGSRLQNPRRSGLASKSPVTSA